MMSVWKINSYENFFTDIVKTSEKELIEILKKMEMNKTYSLYTINKKNGKRHIYALKKNSNLHFVQNQIIRNFLNNIMLSDSCYGFRKGYNYIDFLEPHVCFGEERFYIRVDIKSFFESISISLLEEVLSYYIEESESLKSEQREKILKYIIQILTYKGGIVQGAVTSPVISNIIFRKLDVRISRYCRSLEIEYSRYADDLLFSSSKRMVHSKGFLQRVQEILSSSGFEINYSKIIRSKKEISLNGYVIGDNIRISRKKLENISRILFFFDNYDWNKKRVYISELNAKISNEMNKNQISFSGKYSLMNYLAGNRAFLISLLKYSEDKKIYLKIKKIIDRLEYLIIKLDLT